MIMTQIQSLFESSKKTLILSALQILGASFLLALCSQVSVPLYFTPVCLSLQTLAVMFIGATLGSRKGFLAVLAYLIEGSLGLPVFACGSYGFMALLGPRGGYFLGFLVQVFFVGWFVERQKTFQLPKILSILLLSCLFQLSLGVFWLSHFVGFEPAVIMGFSPFIFGETLKALSITAYLKQFHEKNPNLLR